MSYHRRRAMGKNELLLAREPVRGRLRSGSTAMKQDGNGQDDVRQK